MSHPTELTPLMKQYFSIKEKYPGALLLFRVGDFYETFLEDAVKTSKVLGIVLTKRANGSASSVELAGFPHHSLDVYLPKLIKAGYRVAICDQLEDAKQVKGIVKRGVTELVTPGLSFYESVLEQKSNHYLAALVFNKEVLGIAFLDLSTGEFCLAQGDRTYIQQLLQSFAPAELLFNKKQQSLWEAFTSQAVHAYGLDDWMFQFDYAYGLLNQHFATTTLKGFGIEGYPMGIVAAGVILRYLADTEHKQLQHINVITRLEATQYLWLDGFTISALELMVPQQSGGTALIEVLDRTITPMGGRLLKKWLLFPLNNRELIQARLDIVEALITDVELETALVQQLKPIGDLERLLAKVAAGRVNPREMVALKKSLAQVAPIQQALVGTQLSCLSQLGASLHDCHELLATIHHKLQENPPILTHQGGIINAGVSDKLDELNQMIHSGKDYLVQLQQKESKATHIPSLKISYNRVFGYYLEVPNAHKDKVPTTWIRKQTLTHAERYITEELKYYEEHILQAAEEAQGLEQTLYQALVGEVLAFIPWIQHNAKIIAQLDVYLAFSTQARLHDYCKPLIDNTTCLDLKGNRHPVIEQRLPLGSTYVPNDVLLDQTQQQIIVITGPNMAGKSALLRQVAVTVLMAQMGSFVPATAATIGIVDKIFTRVGASDNLAKGESTFMVEMTETATIMHNLSDRSLVLMDEIGRGTSTYDGISIAWALVEYLHNHPRYKAKTLFATHYHELDLLAESLPRVQNYHVAVQEIEGRILFLHQLTRGSSAHSFGIHVAKMAGMPLVVVERATAVLGQLDKSSGLTIIPEPAGEPDRPTTVVHADSFLRVLKEGIENIDLNHLTPIEALLKLREIQDKLKTYG
ncbi:MAG: DNA mismatch repair protein MutS [Amoebophilaceae bacterium]|nr:DNA mismatch repair protein MutS [Amoebophilaceae bacterium]